MMCFISKYGILLLLTSVDLFIAPPIPGKHAENPCADPLNCKSYDDLGDLLYKINSYYHKGGLHGFDYMAKSDALYIQSEHSRKRRNAWNRNDWPKRDDGLIYIPYSVRDYLTRVRVSSNLAKAAIEFEKHTCFRLIERTDETDYVDIFDNEGCWTYVSKIGGRQPMSLSPGCEHVSIILHEFMHVIGFFHEQERQDRDEHIYMNWTNIVPDALSQFKVKPGFVHGKDYDINSIMHYGRKAAAIDRNYDAMVPRKDPNAKLGTPVNSSFSPGDILGLKLKSLCEVDIKVYGGPYATKDIDVLP